MIFNSLFYRAARGSQKCTWPGTPRLLVRQSGDVWRVLWHSSSCVEVAAIAAAAPVEESFAAASRIVVVVTTAYDNMVIPRIKGERRAVRRQLAEVSRALLNCYRRGDAIGTTRCPLTRGLEREASGRTADGDLG